MSYNLNFVKTNIIIYLRSLLVSILAISCSCNDPAPAETVSIYTIPFAEIVKNKREVHLSEFATDVELIQLENIPEALLGTFEDIEFTNDYIFVMCWTQPVLQFSHTGEFIRQIGAVGNGPEEYGWCLKMTVDEKNERVYIHTNQFNMKVYTFSGEFVKTINNPALEHLMNFWICGRDSMLISYFEPFRGNEPFVFIEHNEQGDTLQGISNYIYFPKNEQADPFHMSLFEDQNFYYRFEDKLHLKGYYNDTVYTFDGNFTLVPKYLIDLGKHKLPEDLIYERKWNRPIPDNLYWTGVHETSDYIFVPYGYHFDQNKPESEKEKKGLVLYNKKTKEGVAIEETSIGGFVDDITGGPDFRPIVTYDNTAVMLVPALDMKQYLDSDEFKNRKVQHPAEKEKLNQLKKTLKEDDNHFLVMIKLKR